MARAFTGTVSTVETKTFSGNPPKIITVRNLDATTNLEVQPAEILEADDWDVIPPGGEAPYRNEQGITSVKIRGQGDVATQYAIGINFGAKRAYNVNNP